MKPHRFRVIPASLALAVAPFMGAVPLASTLAAAPVAVTAEAPAGHSAYGLAARLPKDTEGFVSFYHLRDLWDGFFKSNFYKKVMSNEMLVREMNLDDILREWENNGEVREYAKLAANVFGNEVMITLPAGFTDKLAAILKQVPSLQGAYINARMPSRAGDAPSERSMKAMLPVVEAVSNLEVPPFTLSFKAGASRDMLKGLINQGLKEIPEKVMSKLDRSTFELSGGYSFDRVVLKVEKVVPEKAQADMKRELVRATGDDAKGAALAGKLLAKTVELAWGWVDDYFVLSLGTDHNHLKFGTAIDSILTHPDVAARAAQFAAKNPLSFSYASQKANRTLGEFGGLLKTLIDLAGSAKSAGAPFPMEDIVAELRKLDAKADAIWPNDPDAAVGAAWWDGGLHAEAFGGSKPRSFDNSKPLTFGSLASDKTLVLYESRTNRPYRDKVFTWFEEFAASVAGIYQNTVKPALPPDARQKSAMGEMIALPMVKELWKSFQAFRAAMGEESALLVNLDGAMPSIPQANIPPEVVAKGKIPRLAWMSELKDRAKLTESWNGLKTIISSAAAIASAQGGFNIKTEPVTKKEGNVELWGFELPMETGDVWPHTAVSGDRWFFGSSPSFTKELAGKTPAPHGPACGSHCQINLNALWNFGDAWSALIPCGPQEREQIAFALSMARALGGLDCRCGEENGQSHDSIHIAIKDLP